MYSESKRSVEAAISKAKGTPELANNEVGRHLATKTTSASYSATTTRNAQQNYVSKTLTVCGNVLVSTCPANNGAFTGDTYLRLFDSSGQQIKANDDDSSYSYCSTIRKWFDDCDTVTIRMGCYRSSSCSGTAAIEYNDQDASNTYSPYYDDDGSSSYSSYYYYDDGSSSYSSSYYYYYYYYYYYSDDDETDDDTMYDDEDYAENNKYFDSGDYNEIGYYVDQYYDSMDPIFCVTAKTESISSCFMQVENLLLMPFVLNRGYVNQSGSDNDIIYPSIRCEDSKCSDYFQSGFNITYDDLNNIRYLRNSLLFLAIPFDVAINNGTNQDVIDAMVRIVHSTPYNTQLNAAFDVAMFASMQEMYQTKYPDLFESFILDYKGSNNNGKTLRQHLNESIDTFFTVMDADVLRDTGYFFININEIESVDYLNYYKGTRINAAGLLFYHNYTGFTDPFYQKAVFNKILQTPPVTLVQGYMECTTAPGVAAANNLGIAFSNTTSFGAMFFSLMVLFSIYTLNTTAKLRNKPFVIPKNKKQALNVLALTALMEELVAATNCDKAKCNEILNVLASTNSIDHSELVKMVADSESEKKNNGKPKSHDLLKLQAQKYNITQSSRQYF